MADSTSSAERGMEVVRKLFPGAPGGGGGLPEKFGRMTIEHVFGEVWSDPTLPLRDRSLITCAVLTALGREEEQRMHFRGAQNLGISREELEAMITHVAHYAGWPVAVGACGVLNEISS